MAIGQVVAWGVNLGEESGLAHRTAAGDGGGPRVLAYCRRPASPGSKSRNGSTGAQKTCVSSE